MRAAVFKTAALPIMLPLRGVRIYRRNSGKQKAESRRQEADGMRQAAGADQSTKYKAPSTVRDGN